MILFVVLVLEVMLATMNHYQYVRLATTPWKVHLSVCFVHREKHALYHLWRLYHVMLDNILTEVVVLQCAAIAHLGIFVFIQGIIL